jgi:hypothetical protein
MSGQTIPRGRANSGQGCHDSPVPRDLPGPPRRPRQNGRKTFGRPTQACPRHPPAPGWSPSRLSVVASPFFSPPSPCPACASRTGNLVLASSLLLARRGRTPDAITPPVLLLTSGNRRGLLRRTKTRLRRTAGSDPRKLSSLTSGREVVRAAGFEPATPSV